MTATTPFSYRRRLGTRELLTAAAAGVGVGLVAFYVARLLLQRTPLLTEDSVLTGDAEGRPVRRPVRRPTPAPPPARGASAWYSRSGRA